MTTGLKKAIYTQPLHLWFCSILGSDYHHLQPSQPTFDKVNGEKPNQLNNHMVHLRKTVLCLITVAKKVVNPGYNTGMFGRCLLRYFFNSSPIFADNLQTMIQHFHWFGGRPMLLYHPTGHLNIYILKTKPNGDVFGYLLKQINRFILFFYYNFYIS